MANKKITDLPELSAIPDNTEAGGFIGGITAIAGKWVFFK